MGANYWVTPAIFLIDTAFSLYLFAVLLRFLFQWSGADHQNPLSRFLIRVTHPPLRVMRRLIPSVGRVDTASLLLMLGLQMLANTLILFLRGAVPSLAVIAVLSLSQLLELTLNLYFYAILIRALLSWMGLLPYNPALSLLHSLTEPALRLGRRLLPATGGLDLSPIVPLVAIQLAKMLLLPPLLELAMWLG